jgi:Tol biopolymer transport system component
MRTYFLRWSLIFVLAISSCASETDQPSGQTGQPPAVTPTERPDAYENFPTLIPTNSAAIPVTWASLGLAGKFVFSMGAVDEDNNYLVQIQVLDLATGKITVAYRAPLNSWIYYVSVSPDGRQMVMSYSPPPGENPAIVQALYVLPLDGSKPPELLFMPPTPADQYIQAEWSPDGKYIYFTHVNHQLPEDPNQVYPFYKIFRMEYPVSQGVEPDLIAEEAYWPRLSSDSSRLVYVSADSSSGEHQLTLADPDGANAQDMVLSGPYVPDDKDAPVFSADSQSVIFSGEVPGESYQPNWLEKFVGIRVAQANGEPSDWWSVPVGGGEITRLTYLQTSGLYASVSPDKQHLVSFSRDELFVMKPDGSELTFLIYGLNGFSGTISWIP